MIFMEMLESPEDKISLDMFTDSELPITILDGDDISLDMAVSSPISIDMVSGGISGDPGPKGAKGDKGDTTVVTADVDAFDPGDLTLIFDNKLV